MALAPHMFVLQSSSSLEDNFLPADASSHYLLCLWILSPRISYLCQGDKKIPLKESETNRILDVSKDQLPDQEKKPADPETEDQPLVAQGGEIQGSWRSFLGRR